MATNYWAIICPEPKAPGLWGTWRKEKCVAIGWSPNRHHLVGPTRDTSWEKARSRAQKIKPGDIVIPYLENYQFGIPGKVLEIAIGDDQWNPTVPKGKYAKKPDEPWLGRRINVEWMQGHFPPADKIAVVPRSMRKATGEVRQTVERIKPKRVTRFMQIIEDDTNWKKYKGDPRQNATRAVSKPTPEKIRAGGSKNQRSPIAASVLSGNSLYVERARQAFPILVRQALAGEKIAYSDLADEMSMPNPRNLKYVLGAIGKAIKELSAEWGQEIPPLQCLVVNKNTGLPGEGVAWFISDLKDFEQRTPEERKQILGIELVKVFNYAKWEKVLAAFGLDPVIGNPEVEALLAKARGGGGGVGEGEDHRKLKHYIANNPTVIGLSGFGKGDTEYCFPSADRIDVVFRKDDRWVGVEVKGPSSPDDDLVRGLFQTVKYVALREAELKARSKQGKIDVILVLSRKLPPHLKEMKNLLGVTVVDGVVVPEQDH
ncbi:MAG: hypothetical protein WA517_18085 [Candidatus Acidiferrum sp.]